jgi:AcrR family transcriptional regulator
MPPQPAALRRPDRRRDARQSILAEATRLLRQSGAEALTMRRVAARSGCSAPTLYHYFRDRAALLDALLEEAFRELGAELDRLRPQRDPLAALRAQCRLIVRFCLENPTHFRLMSEARPVDAAPLPALEAAQSRLEEPLSQLAQAGRLRLDYELTRQAIWSLIHGLISLQASRPDVDWSPRLAQSALDGLLAGLLRPGGSRR